MSRFSREDWLRLGLRRLGEAGIEALTIEAICAAAGRTRGSFYHHFQDRDAFLAALAGAWRKSQTEGVIRAVEAGGAAGRPARLHGLAGALDHGLDIAMRRVAAQSPIFAAEVAAVDAMRIDYIARLLEEERNQPPARARALAERDYALFVGCQTLWPDREPLTILDPEAIP